MPEFDRFAGDYRAVLDGSVGSAAYFADGKAQWLARRFGAGFSGKILDFGCGVGLLSEAVLRRLPGARLTGFDVSADSVQAVPTELRQRGHFTMQSAEIGDGFDLVVVSNVLHHVPVADRDAVLADLVQRLRPGGKLAVFEHNPLNPLTRWVVARCAFDDDAILLWPRETLQRLTRAGLTGHQRDYVAFFPKPLARLQSLEARMTWCSLGAQYAALGVKP